jgi:hypothetical protein
MALPGSPNAISMSQINTEIGASSTATISMNDLLCRSLAGDGNTVGSGASWSLGNIRGYSFYKYAVTGTYNYWNYLDTGPVSLYYAGVNRYNGSGNPGSITTGGYTYYRGAQQSYSYSSYGEGGGGYGSYLYSIARA